MLKYKVRVDKQTNTLKKVQFNELYFSSDMSYVSGVSDASYGVGNVNYAFIEGEEMQRCIVDSYDVWQCGYVIYKQTFKIETFEGNLKGILYVDGQYYCVNKDYEKYYTYVSNNLLDGKEVLKNPFLTINGVEYTIGEWHNEQFIEWYNEIVIPVKYYVYDNKITINNVVYDVIIDNKNTLHNVESYYPYIILNDLSLDEEERILYVIDWEFSKRKRVTLFKLYNNNLYPLKIQETYCVQPYEYIEYGNSFEEVTRIYKKDIDNFYEMAFKDKKYIFKDWTKVEKSNYIDLYAIDLPSTILNGSYVIVELLNTNGITLTSETINNENIVFKFLDEIYIVDKNNQKYFIQWQNNEYELFTAQSNIDGQINFYIIKDNKPIVLCKQNTSEYPNTIQINGVSFNVNAFYYLEINNNFYRVNDNGGYFTIIINEKIQIPLNILDVIGNNVIRCFPQKNIDISDIFEQIKIHQENYVFYLKQPLFDESYVLPMTIADKNYLNNNFQLYIDYASYLLPLKITTDVSLNLHQESLLNGNYMDNEKDKHINRIVDMEKDIYYPTRYEKKGNKDVFTLCHQIQIDLHFRSRNLENWVVNENYDVNEYGNRYPSNWNLFDQYRYATDTTESKQMQPILTFKDDLHYYPPSDLLYFLNFTDDDVFYQKQKIGKSFLRLSFYDSPDPNTHSLLYTTTIFMCEKDLYNKYINADKTESYYITLKERGASKLSLTNPETESITETYTITDENIVKHISVASEPCASRTKKNLTFDENKRLSTSFLIKNRYESSENAEGYYLYLFKEYSNGLHERTIYLKVEFNHAGIGKTINFMNMYKTNAQGEKSMINWGSYYNYEKYKHGYTLSELTEHLYIEIKVKYDFDNKRFCYYLPEWMVEKNSDKNTMRLSLFEIKIKDESHEDNI